MKQASPFANERTGLFGYVFSGGLFVQFERDQQSFVVAGPVSSCGGDEFVLAVVFHPLATDDCAGRPYDLGFLDAEPLSGIVINEIDPVAFVGIAGPYQRAYVNVFVIGRPGKPRIIHDVRIRFAVSVDESVVVHQHGALPVHYAAVVVP